MKIRVRELKAMNKNTGFTLIEVLIAMLVLGVGLLGLAGLQATSLSSSQSAYNRSQATELAYDLADRMRANMAEVTASPSTYTTINPTAAAPQADCLAVSTTCTTAKMAQNDLYQWNCAVAGVCQNNTPPIAAALPGGVGTIMVTPTVVGGVNVYTITIRWTDKNNNGVPELTTFQTSFRL